MTKKLDWVAFDVETERLHYEVRGGWDNPADFGFTVGSAVDCEGNERIFSAHENLEARRLLHEHLVQYERIVSFNGLKFDNLVLAAGDDIVRARLDEKAWDIKRLIDAELGLDPKAEIHIVSLEALSKATINDHKNLPDGRDAVRLWRKGEYGRVAEYNLQDARLTASIWRFGLQHGFVLFEPARVPIVFAAFTAKPDSGGLIVVKVEAAWKR